jgi:hypothetical protein
MQGASIRAYAAEVHFPAEDLGKAPITGTKDVGGNDFYSEEADYVITNDDAGFLVNGVDHYSSFQEALNACSGDGSQIIQFGSPDNPLEIYEVSYYTGNALVSAVYQGSLVIKEATPATSYGLTIPDGVDVKFSGLTISSASDMDNYDFYMVYINGGSLTIEEETVINADSPWTTAVYINSGGFTMNGGEICVTDRCATCIANWGSGAVLIQVGTITSDSSLYSVGNYGSGPLIISGGSISNSNVEAIYSQGSGEINISGAAKISSDNYCGIKNSDSAAINISGGEVIGKEYGIFNSYGAIEISDGTVSAIGTDGTAIYSYDNMVDISGGTVEGAIGIWSYGRIIVSGDALIKGTNSCGILSFNSSRDIDSPAVEISNGTVEGAYNAIDNESDGLVRITGGNITGGESAFSAISNYDSGLIDISGGTISGGDAVIYNFSTGIIRISSTVEILSDWENMIKLVRKDERDTSYIDLFGKKIYGCDMANILLKGKHNGGYYSVNSANYTDASLSAEDYEPSTYTLAFWTSDAARTLEIGSGDGSTIGDLTSEGNSEIYAHIALSSFYFDVPGLGAFTDTDESKNIITGELSWTIPVDTSGITGYKVYWGNNSKEKLSADALYTVIGADNCYQEVPDGTPLPDGAEYFLIYSYGATGESYDFLAIPIVDNIVYAQTPGINTQPTGVTVSIGETATFTIIASAPDGGSLSYQWQIKSGSKWIDLSEAATSSSYTTPVATYTDNGTQYRCVVTNSKNGTTATVNSNAATLTVNPDTITAASVTGIVAPSAGESPITVGNLTAGNESYTVVTRLTWENSDGTPATLTAEGKFKAAWTYQAEIEMTAAEGYKFQALTPTVNTGTAASGTLDGEGSMLTFIITFAPTEALAATGISVNIQPAKLIYAEGEALDISGLRVTLAYKDGSTANIGHEQLAANNITVNPENGTIMSAEEHNGQTITLTCNSHTATTDSLTVYTYTINLSETDTFTFTPQRAGYSSVTPLTVTVTRTGTGVITNLAAALSGINSDAFILGELDTTTLDNTVTSAAFTVKPNDGLAAGNYSAVVTVTSDHSVKKEFEIRFTVNRQSASSVTNTSVKDGFDILINGKAVTSATATTILEGNKTVTSVVVDDKKVEEKLEHEGKNSVVTIPVINGSDTVIGALKGQTLKIMENMEAVFEIKTENVSYIIPASQLNIDGFLARLGEQIESKDVDVCVKISEPDSDSVKIVEDTASKNNYQIIVKPIKFEITCTNGDKTVEVSKFNAYVERLIAIPEGVNPSKITTGVVVNPDGTFSHVPTVITMIDGKYYAKINSLTNSMYSVIYSHRTFNDVENHWAQKDILDMASRLIISGAGNDLFEPERSITRAEFAAVMVRALGLGPEEYKNDFSDVKSGDWYSGYISTASYYGLIKGYDDGTFKPDKTVSRQEAMAILVRAMDITKLGEERETGTNTILSTFDDNTDVSDWAKDPIAKCLITGVVTGRNNGCIAPLDGIKRAEAAIMVRRLLINSNLIN